MITLSKKDVGKQFRNAKGEVLTLTKWLDNDPEFPARLGDDDRNYNANGRRFMHREERDTLVARVEENPPCLKTRLRKREIGRKFKTRGGLTVTLERRHAWLPGTWVWKAPNGNLFNCEADGRIHSGNGEGSLDLVERLPVEKKPKPDPFMGFKVGDRVKNPTVECRGIKGVSAKVVEVTNDILKVQFDHDKYVSSVNWADKMMYYRNEDIAAWQKVNVRPYPDYRKMKAALEDIRDNSPIGSDAALKAKTGLEGVEC